MKGRRSGGAPRSRLSAGQHKRESMVERAARAAFLAGWEQRRVAAARPFSIDPPLNVDPQRLFKEWWDRVKPQPFSCGVDRPPECYQKANGQPCICTGDLRL